LPGIPSNVPDDKKLPSTLPILKEALSEHYAKERPGVHVSDLTGCVRKAVWQKLDRRPLTDKELNNFSSGRGIDGAIEDLAYIKRENFRQKPELWISITTGEPIFWYEATEKDICAHPDLWDMKLNFPIEGKSNKTETVWLDKFDTLNSPPPKSNTKQLLAYMAMANKTYGRLLIQYVNNKKTSAFREVDYTRTLPELREIRRELVMKAIQYWRALEAKDVSLAPHIMNEPEPDDRFLCKICPYYTECKKINDG